MKVLLWEMSTCFYNIVLWDGENTYWIEEMKPSSGYKNIKFGQINKFTNSRFTYIGEFE